MTDLKPEDLVKLRERLLAFEDMINMPPTTSRDEPPELRDYRHRIYREWEKLCADTLSLLADRARMEKALREAERELAFAVEHMGRTGGGYERALVSVRQALGSPR